MLKKTNYFCQTSQFMPFVSDDYKNRTEADWIASSKNGDFIPVFRFGAGVFWRKAAVLGWAIRRFGATHPELIEQLHEAGFVSAD